jgi:hypothetical protein
MLWGTIACVNMFAFRLLYFEIKKFFSTFAFRRLHTAFIQFISRREEWVSWAFAFVYSRGKFSCFLLLFGCLTSAFFVQILKSCASYDAIVRLNVFYAAILLWRCHTVSKEWTKETTREELLFNPLQLFMFVESDSAQLETFQKLLLTRSFHAGCDCSYPPSVSLTIHKRKPSTASVHKTSPSFSLYFMSCQVDLIFFSHHFSVDLNS